MKGSIAIRADGDNTIGLGHVFRCLALAHILEDAFSVTFYIRNAPDAIRKSFSTTPFKLETIDTEERFFEMVSSGSIVVVDGYHFDKAYQRNVRQTGCLLVCIDDFHDRDFDCDMIINHAPGVSRSQYLVDEDTVVLTGPEYALLRPAFLGQASSPRKPRPFTRIMMNFGGADSRNFTLGLLPSVLRVKAFQKIAVITGSSYPFSPELEEFAKRYPEQIIWLHNLSEIDMLNQMLLADLGLLPSSGVLFEAIACKLPVVSGYYVNNQLGIYNGFKSLSAFYDAEDLSVGAVERAIDEALTSDPSKMMRTQAMCIDGQSPRRLREAFNKLMRK